MVKGKVEIMLGKGYDGSGEVPSLSKNYVSLGDGGMGREGGTGGVGEGGERGRKIYWRGDYDGGKV